jgi:murein DD-endopeptidase MepM/ murein hydrolase activator NlpD
MNSRDVLPLEPAGEQLTRRALRLRRESEGHGRRRTSYRAAPVPAPSQPHRRGFSRLARPLITATTMLAVAAMAVVTSVPANALLSEEHLVAARLSAFAGQSAQELGTTGGTAPVITRDAVTVRTAAESALEDRFGGVDSFVNNRQSAIQWPFAVTVPITDGFGARVSPCSGCSTQHQGTDFTPGYGAPIQAIADGVVRQVTSSDEGLGVHVVIDHLVDGDLVSSTYAHMQFGSVALSEGQAVKVGDLVGLVGNTGASTGPHLHFEIRLGGTRAVDAEEWLTAHTA